MATEGMKIAVETWNQMVKFQQEVLKEALNFQKSVMPLFLQFNIFQDNMAVFRAKIQSGGRISIPEADRAALGLKEGDVVKVVVIKEDTGGGGNGV